mgnify:CR=1 FL=1
MAERILDLAAITVLIGIGALFISAASIPNPFVYVAASVILMGSGVAYWLSTRNCHVLLKDINSDALAKGMGTIESLYHTSVKRHVLSQTEANAGFDRITASTADLSLKDREIIIEAATEDLELKKKIFSNLSEQSSPNTILATNTSALPVHALAGHIRHPGRLVGIHFFNPVPRMKLVELVPASTEF